MLTAAASFRYFDLRREARFRTSGKKSSPVGRRAGIIDPDSPNHRVFSKEL
jgi:hypothetical protein